MTIYYLTEEMFSSGQHVSQGEVNVWMKKYAPRGLLERTARLSNMRELLPQDGRLIVGHSESGHNHIIEAVDDVPISQAALALIDQVNATIVDLRLMQACALVHQKSGPDAHETYIFPPGEYVCGIREEQTVSGWTRVSD